MSTHVSYAHADGVSTITLVDGDRGNAINAVLVDELHDAVRRAAADSARVIVLGSTGRFFSVGGDIGAFGSTDDLAAYIDDLAEALHRVVSELVRNPAVVISVVHGPAAGAGFPLAAAADIVLAGLKAKFTLGYTKIGLSVDGGTSLLVNSLGLHRVLRLALMNDTMDAEEALAVGLVARLYENDELTEAAEKLARDLAAGPAGAFAATKKLIRDAAEPAPEAVLRAESLSIRELSVQPDGREGVAAFLEKRAASFNAAHS
ncbi:2-(1,2-epoxy-1,2-dihydrophenyl)acetyl-CoA isomerase [Marmoricola sp. OAE513]|uniref:enoyl-CoA hydratase/isomerase family protein n=1 Tax=Marmoricola sp. OAE513 TaxID=2817894 RepID=UPI001AE6B361